MLTGCDIVDGPSAEKALRVVSQFNDWVQARLFNPNRLAPTYAESAVTRPFPFQRLLPRGAGPRRRRRTATSSSSTASSPASSPGRFEQLYALPQQTQITRLVLRRGLERPSASGPARPLKDFLVRIGAEPDRQVCALRLRRGILGVDRHADRPASADADDLKFDGQLLPTRLGFPPAHPHPHQARLQEPQVRRRPRRAQQLHGRLLGG